MTCEAEFVIILEKLAQSMRDPKDREEVLKVLEAIKEKAWFKIASYLY